MARRRWLLFALSIASLVILTYASVLLAFSVDVTPEMRAANADAITEGRAIVLPAAQPRFIRTEAANGDGALLAIGQREGTFPASARDVSVLRAIAFVNDETPRALEVVNVTMPNGTQNVTIDLDAIGARGEGFVVKGDAEETPRFVATGDVLGHVDRVESTGALAGLFLVGAIGFVAPLVVAIATHRGAGRRGAPGAGFVCRRCRGTLAPDATFCLRCGEYREEA